MSDVSDMHILLIVNYWAYLLSRLLYLSADCLTGLANAVD